MKEIGYISGLSKDLQGNLILSFEVDDNPVLIEEVEKLKGKQLSIEFKKYHKKRSLDANAYFWQLCDQIARVLGSNLNTIYLMMLRDAGVWIDVRVKQESVDMLNSQYRLCEVLAEHDYGLDAGGNPIVYCDVRCYLGSHTYDTAQMSHLIQNAVNQAEDLGIQTLTTDEREHMLSLWGKNG